MNLLWTMSVIKRIFFCEKLNLVIVVEYVSFLYMPQNASNHLFSNQSYMELRLLSFFAGDFFREIKYQFHEIFRENDFTEKTSPPKTKYNSMYDFSTLISSCKRSIGLWSWAFSFVSYLISNEIIRLQKSKGIKYSSIAGLNFLYIIGNMYNK